jgi:hypothetical protein
MMEEMNDSNYTLLNFINPHQNPIILYKWVTEREGEKKCWSNPIITEEVWVNALISSVILGFFFFSY